MITVLGDCLQIFIGILHVSYRRERSGTSMTAPDGFPMWVVMFYAGGALAGLIEAIINNWWKISAHGAGVAGLVALLVRMSHTPMVNPDVLTWLIVAVACAGLTGSARLWLGRHTLGQVLAGYAVGFCSVYFLTMI